MATKYLAPAPKFTVIDANGDPVSGGLVYVTSAGTTTPAATYSNGSGSVNADPVVLDSFGQCDLWLTTGLKFDIRVTTSTGVLLWTATKVSSPVTPSTYFTGLMDDTTQAELFTSFVAAGGTITGALVMESGAQEWAANVTVNSLIAATPIGAAASNNVIVAPGQGETAVAVGANAVMTSTDGSTWTSRTPSQGNTWNAVAYSPSLNLFVAVSEDGTNRVMSSPDGTTWTNRTAAEANQWTDVTWSPSLGLFVAVAQSGTNRVMYSSNGTSWSTASASAAVQWQRVRWSPELGQFCATAFEGNVMTSTNGTTWTARTPAAANRWYGLAWSPSLGLWAASASNGLITDKMMTSPDGVTWTSRTAASNIIYVCGAWSPSLAIFAFPAQTGTASQKVQTSSNGTTWADAGTGVPTNIYNDVCWSVAMGKFIAVSSDGTGNRVLTSTNGSTWTAQTSASDSAWSGVITNG